jgi:outer membrane protein assembly factor BamB
MRVNLPRLVTMTGGLLLTGLALGQEWPNWRAPNHDGISLESGFLTRWDAPPKQLWQARIGSAFSAVSCVDGRAYTCGTQAGQQVLLCLDADSGQITWQLPFEEEYRERQGGDGTGESDRRGRSARASRRDEVPKRDSGSQPAFWE